MSLTPLILTDEEINTLSDEELSPTDVPSKTWLLDFDTGEIYTTFIDGTQAVAQAVAKAVKTRRDRYLIYSSDYGCDIFYLLGSNYSMDYLNIEVPRLINEAVMDDERVLSVDNFVIERDGDSLNVSFDLTTNIGDSVTVEVSL